MAMSLDWMFEALLHHSQNIESSNNNMRLHLLEKFDGMSASDVEALTKRYPDWRKDMEQVFFDVQDAMEGPVGKLAVAMEDILGEREKLVEA